MMKDLTMTDERIKTIFDHYKEDSKLEKSIEELDELKEAIGKLIEHNKLPYSKKWAYYRSNRDAFIDHIAEEIADVRIMLDQLSYGLKIEQRTADWREMKLERQIKRIGGEN